MKLTPEQEAIAERIADSFGGEEYTSVRHLCEESLAAGYRLGFEAAREAAAKVCERQIVQPMLPTDPALNSVVRQCIHAIRAIPLPGGKK